MNGYPTPVEQGSVCVGIDPCNVAVLNDWMAWSGSELVVSSTWRLIHHEDEFDHLLRKAGYTGPKAVGYTPDLEQFQIGSRMDHRTGRGCRGDEIAEWLSYNDWVDDFVIFDDMGPSQFSSVKSHLIRTSPRPGRGGLYGLHYRHLIVAAHMLASNFVKKGL